MLHPLCSAACTNPQARWLTEVVPAAKLQMHHSRHCPAEDRGHMLLHTSATVLLAVHLSHTAARSKRSKPSASPCIMCSLVPPERAPVLSFSSWTCPIPPTRAAERTPSSPLRGPSLPFPSSPAPSSSLQECEQRSHQCRGHWRLRGLFAVQCPAASGRC